MSGAPGVFFLALSLLLSIPVNGVLLAATWAWFIVPIFNVRQISVAEAIGLSIFLSVVLSVGPQARLGPKPAPEPGEDKEAYVARMVWTVVNQHLSFPILCLLFAWLWHVFFTPSSLFHGL